jgi:hypothetical protein
MTVLFIALPEEEWLRWGFVVDKASLWALVRLGLLERVAGSVNKAVL